MKEHDTKNPVDDLLSIYHKETSEFLPLTGEQEKQVELMTKYGSDEEREAARYTLVFANLEPVLNRMRNFKQNLEPEDLIQEVCVSLLSAAKEFNADLGYKFSTYAGECVYKNITRVIKNTGFNFIPPEEVFKKGPKVEKARKTLSLKLNKEPTMDEISNESHVPKKRIEEIFRYNKTENGVFSFDEKELDINGNFDMDDVIDERMMKDDVDKLLNSLDNKIDADVLRKKHGLADGEEKTYKEIAHDFGATHQRIQQRYVRAKKRLNVSQMSQNLGFV